jgi:hypothetical protein
MNERLEIADLNFNFACPAEERAKFTRTPPNKSWFVLPLEMMPTCARAIQARDRLGAIGRNASVERFLVDHNQWLGNLGIRVGLGPGFLSFSPRRHPANLRNPRTGESVSLVAQSPLQLPNPQGREEETASPFQSTDRGM